MVVHGAPASPVAASDLCGIRERIDTLIQGGLPAGNMAVAAADPAFALMWLVGAACAIGAATQAKYHRLAALSLAGAAGLATCMTFVWFSAPDLALTQLIVEVVTLVLILLGLRWLPPRYKSIDEGFVPLRARVRARTRRLRDLGLAIIAGAGMAALSFAVLTRQAGEGISPFFIENSLPLAGGAKRDQCDPGRFPRFRYAGRDYGAGHRGADGVRAVAAVPARD